MPATTRWLSRTSAIGLGGRPGSAAGFLFVEVVGQQIRSERRELLVTRESRGRR
jgi:hypothetical protein